MSRPTDPASTGRREDVLRALQASTEPRTISDLANEVDVHPNTVRFHLDRLIDGGRVERIAAPSGRRAAGRPAQLFRAVRAMDPAGPRSYALLAEALVHALGTGEESRDRALQAGRAWGHSSARDAHPSTPHTHDTDQSPTAKDRTHVKDAAESVSRLVEMLDEQGFAPAPVSDLLPATIGLHHCPFLELAQQETSTVCAMHLGMMQGATEDSGVIVDSVEPFAEPDRCVAHITIR